MDVQTIMVGQKGAGFRKQQLLQDNCLCTVLHSGKWMLVVVTILQLKKTVYYSLASFIYGVRPFT